MERLIRLLLYQHRVIDLGNGVIKITADTSQVDQKILALRMGISQIHNDKDMLKAEISAIATQGRQIASMFMSNMKQTTALQTYNMIQMNVMMGIQMKNVMLQAEAALVKGIAGNPLGYVEATMFSGIATLMGFNMAKSTNAIIAQQKLQQQTERINIMRDSYS